MLFSGLQRRGLAVSHPRGGEIYVFSLFQGHFRTFYITIYEGACLRINMA